MKNILFLVITVMIILAGVFSSTRIPTVFSYRQFALSSPEELERYEEFHKPFKTNNDVLILGIESDSVYTQLHQFNKLQSTLKQIENLDGIDTLHFLTTIDFSFQQGDELIHQKFLPLDNTELFYERLHHLGKYSDITRKFLSEDRRSLCVYLFLAPTSNKQKIIAEVSRRIDKQHHFLGYTLSKHKIETSLKSELLWITLIGLLAMSILFLIIYRSLKKLIYFFLITAFSVGIYYLIIWFSGVQLGVLSASIPLLIAVISVSDTIHVIESYQRDSTRVYSKLGRALFFTSLTTAISFGVFLITNSPVIIEFALLAITGILIAFLVARFYASKLFFLLESSNRERSIATVNFSKYKRNRVPIIAVFLILGGLMILPHSKLKTDHYLHRNFISGSSLSQANEFYYQNFDDPRKLEIFLYSDSNVLTPENISTLKTVENYLYDNYDASHIESPLLSVRRLNRARRGGSSEYFSIPENIDTTFLNRVLNHRSAIGLKSTLSKDQKVMRIVVGSEDFGSAASIEKNKALSQYLKHTLPEELKVYIGGPTTLQDKASIMITKMIYRSILIASTVLFLLLSFSFRSLLIGFAGMFVNIFPLLVVTTAMWGSGAELNPGNIMALSIILGIAVDDSIHFLSRYKINLQEHPTIEEATLRTLQTVMRPVTITSLLLMIGFAALYFSSIETNHTNSLYFILGMGAALIADILFLPAILSLIKTRSTQ